MLIKTPSLLNEFLPYGYILINSKTHKTKGIDRQVSGCLGPKERGTEEKWYVLE